MPNVKGLDPAPILLTSLNQGELGPTALTPRSSSRDPISGPRACSAGPRDGRHGRSKPSARANLARIDGDTVTAVNALLRPYGKVKTYWRTGEYRWHPVDGAASKAARTTSGPVSAARGPRRPPSVLEDVEVIVPAPVVGPSGHQSVASSRRSSAWQRQWRQAAQVQDHHQDFSTVGDVLVPSSTCARSTR